jgi:uncharacterized protein (TIGR02301 family)
MWKPLALLFTAILACANPMPARAAEAPYDPQLARLAEVLGSLHFLRNLCGESSTRWRDEMEALLASEDPEPERRAKFIASFNHGYRSFEGVYSSCTASAAAAITRYMKEGEVLTRDVTARFGN